MPNAFKENVWVLDTADPNALLQPAPSYTRLKGIRWTVGGGGAVAGTTKAVLKDASGYTMWEAIATATNVSDESALCFDLRNGLILSTLGAGTLYLYLE